jgi:hypothetical protein
MKAIIDRGSRSATEFLEAEVEAWRSMRSVRPVAKTGIVTVVRMNGVRRGRWVSGWTADPVSRPVSEHRYQRPWQIR